MTRQIARGNEKVLDRSVGDLGRLPLRRSPEGPPECGGARSHHGANGTPSSSNVPPCVAADLTPCAATFLGPSGRGVPPEGETSVRIAAVARLTPDSANSAK